MWNFPTAWKILTAFYGASTTSTQLEYCSMGIHSNLYAKNIEETKNETLVQLVYLLKRFDIFTANISTFYSLLQYVSNIAGKRQRKADFSKIISQFYRLCHMKIANDQRQAWTLRSESKICPSVQKRWPEISSSEISSSVITFYQTL